MAICLVDERRPRKLDCSASSQLDQYNQIKINHKNDIVSQINRLNVENIMIILSNKRSFKIQMLN